MKLQQIQLREFVEADSATTFEDGVLKNILVLGANSRNHRTYTLKAMKKAVPLYEGVAVYQDHPTGVDRDRKGRSAADRFGVIQSVRFVEQNGGQVRGDLSYLKTHPMAPRVAEDWSRGLNFFGLSHLADGYGRTEKGSNMTIVESIDKVTEVDLVTNPATAVSLREQEETQHPEDAAHEATQAAQVDELQDQALETGVLAIIRDPALSTEEKMQRVQELFKAHLSVHEAEEGEGEEKVAEQTVDLIEVNRSLLSLTEQVATVAAENKALAEQVAAIKKRKYLPGGDATPVTLTEQQAIVSKDPDAYPEKGTPAEQAAWLRRRS